MTFSDRILNSLRKKQSIKNFTVKKLKSYEPKNLFYVKKLDDQEFIKSRLTQMKIGYLEMLKIEDFSSLNEISTTPSYFYGFLIIVEKKMFLFNSIDNSNEVYVELDTSEIKNKKHFLFTGMILAVEGINPNGNKITASRIYDKQIVSINYGDSDEGQITKKKMSVAFLSGPFEDANEKSEENNEEKSEEKSYKNENIFSSLDNLKINSDILVILGPIMKRKTFFEKKYKPELIYKEFASKLTNWLQKSPHKKVILVPAVEDIHTLGIFPHGPYENFPNSKSMILLSNPAQFYIENVLFSVCTNDLLLEMNKTGIELKCDKKLEKTTSDKWPQNSDKIKMLAAHLIYQRTFLPALDRLNTPISMSDESILKINTVSDVFVTCSKLKPFIHKDSGPFAVANIGSQPNLKNKNVLMVHVDFEREDWDEKFNIEFKSVDEFV